MTRKWKAWITLPAALMLAVPIIAVAQQQRLQQDRQQRQRDQNERQRQADRGLRQRADDVLHDLNLARARAFIDKEIHDRNGRSIGEVEDVIIDPNHGVASFIIIDADDDLLGDDRYLPVPFSAVKYDPTQRDRLYIDVDRARLEGRRGFRRNNPPDFTDRRYVVELYEHYEVEPYWQARRQQRQQLQGENQRERRQAQQPQPRRPQQEQAQRRDRVMRDFEAVRFSELDDHYSVQNMQDEKLGEVVDMLIDMQEGRIAYVVVAEDDDADVLALVPFAAVDYRAEENHLLVDATAQQMRRLSIRRGDWSNLADEQWARNLHREYNEEPYWEVFGYERFQEGQWEPGSAYNRLYNRQREQMLRGEVMEVEKFSFREGGREGVRVVVRDEQGRRHVVHLGPAKYVERQTVTIREGDDVEITGSSVTFMGQPVILARKVEKDGQTLELRDAQGRPNWDPGVGRTDQQDREDLREQQEQRGQQPDQLRQQQPGRRDGARDFGR